MPDDRSWNEIEELFAEARNRPPDERKAFLEERCGDEELVQEILALLAAYEEGGDFFEELSDEGVGRWLGGVDQAAETPAPGRPSDPLALEGFPVGRYAVQEHLGGGGMGVVYKAKDTDLGRPVALKFLPPRLTRHEEARKRFVREARAAARLEHPNIATIHEIGETEEGRRFIAMSYYAGETLKEKLAREGKLPVEEALDYAIQIAEGLAAAHAAGIIHRDIKPANVIVTEEGEVKIVDFGLAQVAAETRLTDPGRRLGTASYMSPEQARGEEVGLKTDLWALGAVVYEMLTGRRPFQGKSEQALLYEIVHEEPPGLQDVRPEVSETVADVTRRLLAKDPGHRPEHAREVADQLRAAGPTAPATSFPAEPRRGLSIWGGAAAFLTAVLLIAGLLFYGVPFGSQSSADEAGLSPASAVAAPSIAVLPFQVSGPELQNWAEGMITALYLNLDGAAGLRAIPARTVLAGVQQHARSSEDLSTREALEVARGIGARYGVVGSAVQMGEDLRFGANVYEVSSGKRLGQVEVRGVPDHVTGLVDKLTRRVLGVLLERSEERIPTVDLKSLTTESLPALKAYLEGERRFRAGDYEAALERFKAAIEHDTTFALAHHRLASSMIWAGKLEEFRPHVVRAYELSGRLPLRERRLVSGWYTFDVQNRALAARDSRRHLTEVYPEDSRMWNGLAETLFHGDVPGGWPEAEQAFLKVAALDPGIAQVHHHLVDLAISLHRDSALAAQRIAAHPDGDYRQAYQVALGLVFGTKKQRQQAFARLDSIPSSVPYLWIRDALAHPADQQLQTEVLKAFRERPGNTPDEHERFTRLLAMSRLEGGQLEEAMALLQNESALLQEEKNSRAGGTCILAFSRSLGRPIPRSLERLYLDPAAIGEEGASPRRLLCAGIYLVDEGREEELDVLMARLRESGQRAEGRDTARAEVAIHQLQGYRAWKAGNTAKAERLWSTSKPPFWPWGALWRGDLYRERGQWEKAEDWYIAAWPLPLAHERLGRLYERTDRPEKAAAAYERFLKGWTDADPSLQERVSQARERLEQLATREPEQEPS